MMIFSVALIDWLIIIIFIYYLSPHSVDQARLIIRRNAYQTGNLNFILFFKAENGQQNYETKQMEMNDVDAPVRISWEF